MSETNKNDLMKELQTVSFVMDDIRLFLDTHPFETDALTNYESFKTQRNQTLAEYSKFYGPLLAYDVAEDSHWTWVEQPWPWEGEV